MKSINRHIHLAVLLSIASLAAAAADQPPAKDAPKAAAAKPWPYQSLKRPAVPQVQDARWVRTPIDAFVLARLEAKSLKPSAEAERAAFIRRATLDAWGLLPTPEEVKAFVADKSPNAHEKLVDRLLASPRYGERQGRRWLDLARYADSDGYNTDGNRPNMWRYRDYVIKAFNDDKPFDRFVKEQLAGDELWPDNNEALVATGFLRSFPDEINARDLNLKKQEVANDLTDTVGSVFLGTTFNCAQCHDHKYDKLSQKEYYQFQAFFVNASWRDDVLALSGKERAEYELKKAKWEAATKDIRDQQEAILKPVIDKLESDRLSGFVPATRESIMKPASERNAYDRWIYHRNLWTMQGRTRNAVNQLRTRDKENYAKYQALAEELRKFDHLKPRDPGNISTMTELGHADAPPTRVLFKGIYDRPLDEVQPGFPALFTEQKPSIQPTATSSGRRTALANWLTSADNPLTARVFVNRQWAQFFGRGIVETVSDFGKAGTRPTHPELLDYLADDFARNGWSVKKLHRQIMLSSVYRQASTPRADTAADPDNKLLWAFPRQRLEAEQIRDSLLAAAGLLEEKLGGPAVMPPLPPNFDIGGQRSAWVTSENPHDHYRRSAYIFVRRNNPYPLLDTFDWANPQNVHNKRDVTTTAPQALALVNSELVFEWSKALAGRLQKEAPASEAAQLDRLFQILYSRLPSLEEKRALLAFLDKQEALLRKQASGGKKLNVPEGWGVKPEVAGQIDKFYKTVYGRAPDRFEKASFVQYLDKQQEKAAKARGAGDDDEDDAPSAARKGEGKQDPARAAAFVDLVHAVANSNEFLYRF
ncbi:DUF1549 and DUF1553 domain-containing protein [uncultured Azohydromonas sp.]|jgi:Protein of unknown function (DUF1553)./Protein of unknown function (DUF1549).|uniref:DUF1549 and DUF1553 domain-containing protein n=1 Tax=uncultured Azohydromonas sp. TaxID=487342 RepID=UPI0026097030|nr:DUF1549 and DUF1553 domain-containing protein [uncultured Azohydromonas sp.]